MLDRLLRWLGLPTYAEAAQHERVFIVLIVAVSVLFIITVLFAMLVVTLRARHVRRRRRRDAREERWHEAVLDVLGGAPPALLQDKVQEGEEIALLAYLLTFARRLRGDEARALAGAASPYLDAARRNLRARSPERRANAVQSLAAFGDASHLQAVLEALDDPSPYVAMNAAQALARPEHSAHAAQVIDRLWRFEQWSPDHLSAMLGRIGPPAAEPARRILGDPAQAPHARAVAADVLLHVNDWLGADVAARVLEEANPDVEVARSCLRLLAGMGRAEHVELARRYSTAKRSIVRAEAVRTAAAIGGPREVDAITAALHDPSTWVAHEAAVGLIQLGRADVVRELASGDTPVALVARQALAEGGA
jgi:HEAT repeat protein